MPRSRRPDWEEMRAAYPWCELTGVADDILDDASRGGRGAYLFAAVSMYYLVGLVPSLPLVIPLWLFADVPAVGIMLVPELVGLLILRLGAPLLCKYRIREHMRERGTWEAGDWAELLGRE